MIGSWLDPIRQRRLESLVLVLGISFALALPAFGLLITQKLQAHANQWLQAYEPTVYLKSDASKKDVQALQAELASWPAVQDATLRTPKMALLQLESQFGEESVRKLGVSASMMPQSIRVKPVVALHGHLELAASVEALKVRPAVMEVDVPTGRAVGVMQLVRASVVVMLLVLFVALMIALVQLGAFLRRVQRSQWAELSLLEQFGAPRSKLRRPMMLQSLVLGFGAGVIASLLLCLAQWGLGSWDAILGASNSMAATAAVVGAPLLVGPLLGFVVGKFAGIHKRSSGPVDETTSLIQFDRHALHLA